MPTPSDAAIARAVVPRPLVELAGAMGIAARHVEPRGDALAKIRLEAIADLAGRPPARYVVITAITPTPLGEGKTTTAIGLGQALQLLGKRATVSLRQPSMGPTFGIKGGAAGAGYSQVIPADAMNLHLTGDSHAVSAAHNLAAAVVDNHLYHGNQLGLDPHRVSWRRVLDVNDRALRNIVIGLGGPADGVPRQTGFDITAASEVMAVLALADGLADLRERLGRIIVGVDHDGRPVTTGQLGVAGAMATLLRDAVQPNLLQSVEGTPVLVHAGPFGNIATGNCSVLADLLGSRCGDYLVTEAGFGADMGAERFFNIKCRASGLVPDAAVIVATVRALKVHGGDTRVVPGRPLPEALAAESPDDVRRGAANLRQQIRNVEAHGVRPVVAINAFPGDHESEWQAIAEVAAELGIPAVVTSHVAEGGKGALALAEAVMAVAEAPGPFRPLYPLELPLADKVRAVGTAIYGAAGVELSPLAARQLAAAQADGFGGLPVCIAKTHLSLSADPNRRGAPTGWLLPVREARVSAGAGFVYLLCGEVNTMPGLGAHPRLLDIDIDAAGHISGLG